MKKIFIIILISFFWNSFVFSKNFESIFGFSFQLDDDYELIDVMNGKQILSKIDNAKLKNNNFKKALENMNFKKIDVFKSIIERYSYQGRSSLNTGEGIIIMLGFTEDEMIKEPIEAKDFKVLCDEEFNMQTYNAVIPIHKCETTNLPKQSKWSFYMIYDSTYDVTNNIPKEKRRKMYMAHFLLEKVSYQIQGSCVPEKCPKLEKNINKILSTLNY